MALDHRLRLLSIGYTETPLAVSSSPGECPMWMQNAMRGYWKLACRPPRSSAVSKSVLSAPSYFGPQHRSNAASVVATSLAGAPSSAPDSSGPSTAVVYKHGQLSDAGSGPASAAALSSSGAQTQRSGRKIKPLGIHPSSSAAYEIPASSQSSLILSPSLQTHAAFSNTNTSTLPLLEALLSTTTTMPPDSAPASLSTFVLPPSSGERQQQRAAAEDVPLVGALATTSGTKRPRDGQMADSSAVVQPLHGSGDMDSVSPGISTTKRMRHADRPVAAYDANRSDQDSGFRYGYPEPVYALPQQQQQQQPVQLAPRQLANAGQSTYPLSHEIAQLATGMGLESINAQTLAANMSNPSVQMLPAASAGGNNPGIALPMDAAEIQRQIQQQQQNQQLYQHSASVAGNFVLPNNPSSQMFAAAVSNSQQQQYAAGFAFAPQMGAQYGIPSLPAVPSLSTSHTGPGQPLDQMVVELQRPPHSTSVMTSAPGVGSGAPTNEFDYRMHGFVPDGAK
ncbi:hypothetical protein H4R20_006238 [Coemansia guatemalensis]|uniref:Uncharacterized protein n=1 Tax=Coemansia guatemalensis TaxID=2761395 RepID=A0A9W8LQ17_9FUNG|nr:hypothetical protein H4R20_006238 [Coemansia guatemalensis]